MTKVKTYPWDAADHIETGEDAILFLQISLEDYDSTFGALMDCIARSKGVAYIASVVCHETGDGGRLLVITTTSGAEATIDLAPEVDLNAIRRAMSPELRPAPVSA